MSSRNEKAVEYLKGLDIQTTAFGGFNREATYEAFKGLSDLYEGLLTEATSNLQQALDDKSKQLEQLSKQAEEKAAKIDELTARVTQLQNESSRMRANTEDMIDQLRASAESEKRAIMDDAERRVGRAEAEAKRTFTMAQNNRASPSAADRQVPFDDVPAAAYASASRPARESYRSQQSPRSPGAGYEDMLGGEITRAQREMEQLRKQAEIDLRRYRAEAEDQLRRFKSERDSIVSDLRQVRDSVDQMLSSVGTDRDQ